MIIKTTEITIMNAAKRVQLSSVFRLESAWRNYLLNHPEALSQLTGLRMHPERPEVPQGNLRFDLLADSADGRRVLVELQFGKSDNRHLGQVLAYAANSDADLVIWMAEDFLPEHLTAVNYLNTKGETSILAVKVGLFETTFRDMTLRQLRADVMAGELDEPDTETDSPPSERVVAYTRYWGALNERLKDNPAYSMIESRQKRKTAIWRPNTGVAYDISLNRQASVISMSMDRRNNPPEYCEAVFEAIIARQPDIEATLGKQLTWDATYYKVYFVVDDAGYANDGAGFSTAVNLTAENYERFQQALEPVLRSLDFTRIRKKVETQANAAAGSEETEELNHPMEEIPA